MNRLFSRGNRENAKGSGLLFRKILYNSFAFITVVAISLGITFMFFSGRILKSQITKSSTEVLRQILYNLDQVFTFIDSSMISLSSNGIIDMTLKSTELPIKKFSEYQDIIDMMRTLKNTNKYIHSVFFYLENDGKVLSSQGTITDVKSISGSPWINVYQQKQNGFINTHTLYDESLGKTVSVISIVKSLPLIDKNLKYGALVVNLDEKQLNSTINSDRIRKNEQILIIDQEGAIISSKDSTLLYQTFPWSEAVSKLGGTTGTYQTQIDGKEHFIIYHSMEKYQWKVVSIIPSQDLFSEFNRLLVSTIIIIAMGLFVFLPLVGLFSKRLYNPIQKLVNMLKQENLDKSTWMKDDMKFINQSVNDILKDREAANQMLERIKPVAQEKFLKNLLTDVNCDQQKNKAQMQMLGIEFGWEHFTVIVIEIDKSVKGRHLQAAYVQSSFMVNFKDRVKAYIEENGYANYIVEIEESRIVVIINSSFEEQKDFDNIYIMCLELKEQVARENAYTITVGIGNAVYEIGHINTSYQQAIHAVEQKLVFGKNSVIRICDIQDNPDKSFSNRDFIQTIIKNLRDLNMDGAIETINQMTDAMVSEKVDSKTLHKFFYSLLNIITFTISDMDVNTELVFSSSTDLMDDFLKNEDVDDIKEWFFTIFKRVEEAIEQKESSVPNEIIERVKEYIHTHYMSDISLGDMSNVVYLHPHYLGKLFKKQEGITVNEYLTYVRMERAKVLLAEEDLKIAHISELVGISSPQYFIHCFKNYQGVTPKKFREMNRESFRVFGGESS